jgi:uncharacterized membrane protein YeiB
MSNRIVGFDIARALAVFGMVVVNFKIVMVAEKNGLTWLDSAVGLLDGRAAATFVVLAGAGISLLSQKARASGDADQLVQARTTLLKRAVFLLLVGLLYTPIWPGDILHFYGVYIAVAAFLLAAPARRLWTIATALVLAFPLMLFTLDYERGWDWATLSYDGLWTPAGMIRNLFFNGFHPVIPWLAFLLVGMVLGRLDMGNTTIRKRVFAWGAGVTIAAEAASWLLVRTLSHGETRGDQEAIAAIFGTEPMPPMPLYVLAGGGIACAVVAAAIALGERYQGAAWLRPFVATGQLALTLYVAHVVVGMGVLDVVGRLENQTLPFVLLSAAIFCALAMLFATLWRTKFMHGPLEAVMRALTDARMKPVSQ